MTRLITLAMVTIMISTGSVSMATESKNGALNLDTATSERIKTELSAQGYDVRKVELEDGMYEAYALKDGEKYEIYLDADLKVVKTEIND